jgi:hypothetical protein
VSPFINMGSGPDPEAAMAGPDPAISRGTVLVKMAGSGPAMMWRESTSTTIGMKLQINGEAEKV